MDQANKDLEPAQLRIVFLHLDLDSATTFVGVAKAALGSDLKQSKGMLEKARLSLDTVRRLIKTPPRIAPAQAEELAKRCDELETSIPRV
jgi:hypothetical protein